MSASVPRRATGLRANYLSFPDIFSQSIALISPTAGAALNAPLVFASAGNGAWFSQLLALFGLVLVSLCMGYFARRSASAGALYTYVAKGLGSTAGVVCGWALTLAYLTVAAAVVAGSAIYINLTLATFNIQLPLILLGAILIGICWYYAHTDVQLATVLMLLAELTATIFIAILLLITFANNGFRPDVEQLTLANTTPNGISLGMVIAIFSFVGFESAATLGDEAKSPARTIPRALLWSTISAGIFAVFIVYAEVLGFRASELPLNESTTPLSELAKFSGVELLGVGINVGIIFSYFSCLLASLNAGARIMYALARHRFYPAALGAAHPKNKTPHVAIFAFVVIIFLMVSLMSLVGLSPIEIYTYLATFSTYGFLTGYILLSIAAPIYLARQGLLRQHQLLISLGAGFFMLLPVASSFYPMPAYPYNLFPYLFLVYLAIGGWLLSKPRSATAPTTAAEPQIDSSSQQFK